MMRRHAGTDGFSLLEVLVALAIVAIALTAVVRASGFAADAVVLERERTLAAWVAANALTETLLAEPFPELGERSGRERMGPVDFRWRLVVQATEDPEIRRLDVRVHVADEEARAAASLSGFANRR
jgi:general secretion pathway protein I